MVKGRVGMRRLSEVFVWFIGTSNECHTRGDNLPRQWKFARGPSACWSVRQMGEYDISRIIPEELFISK